MCSNGYSHAQPCPPGTRTSGYPSYKAGYYYGYTDLCSVNLVDLGYGPDKYAPAGLGYESDSRGDGRNAYRNHDASGYSFKVFDLVELS